MWANKDRAIRLTNPDCIKFSPLHEIVHVIGLVVIEMKQLILDSFYPKEDD